MTDMRLRDEHFQHWRTHGYVLVERGGAFPYVHPVISHDTLHSAMLAVAQAWLGTCDLRLSEAGLHGRYAGAGDHEQSLHLDYGNTTRSSTRRRTARPRVRCLRSSTGPTLRPISVRLASCRVYRRTASRRGPRGAHARNVPICMPTKS